MQGKKIATRLKVNKSIVGESLEMMILRMKEGEGLEGIEDRDLVYNDGETTEVNPITDIRLDKRGLMLDEKQGYLEYRKGKAPRTIEEEEIETSQEE